MARKFNVFDKVWVMFDNRPSERAIASVEEIANTRWQGTFFRYRVFDDVPLINWFPEHQVFPTKQALLESL